MRVHATTVIKALLPEVPDEGYCYLRRRKKKHTTRNSIYKCSCKWYIYGDIYYVGEIIHILVNNFISPVEKLELLYIHTSRAFSATFLF